MPLPSALQSAHLAHLGLPTHLQAYQSLFLSHFSDCWSFLPHVQLLSHLNLTVCLPASLSTEMFIAISASTLDISMVLQIKWWKIDLIHQMCYWWRMLIAPVKCESKWTAWDNFEMCLMCLLGRYDNILFLEVNPVCSKSRFYKECNNIICTVFTYFDITGQFCSNVKRSKMKDIHLKKCTSWHLMAHRELSSADLLSSAQ